MLIAAIAGGLEVRAEGDGSQTIAGRFPYSTETELARGRYETFAPRAFRAEGDIHLLYGHDYNRPLASRRAGSLTLDDGDDALSFEARITPDVAGTSHGKDTLALVAAGLSVGLSPGFRLAPGGDRVERRSDGVLRTVSKAELFELSIVTRPAYDQAQVEARSWAPNHNIPMFTLPAAYRWR